MHFMRFFQSMNGGNVGMIQRGQHSGLALEASPSLGFAGEDLGQNFDGDLTAKLGIGSPVDYPHASSSDLLFDTVVRQGLADQDEALGRSFNERAGLIVGAKQRLDLHRQ